MTNTTSCVRGAEIGDQVRFGSVHLREFTGTLRRISEESVAGVEHTIYLVDLPDGRSLHTPVEPLPVVPPPPPICGHRGPDDGPDCTCPDMDDYHDWCDKWATTCYICLRTPVTGYIELAGTRCYSCKAPVR